MNMNVTKPILNGITKFDSVDAMIATAESKGGLWNDNTYGGSHEDGNARFRGTDSFAEAVGIAKNGWKQRPSSKIANSVAANLSEQEAPTYALQHDVVGGAVDVGAYMTGEPECMLAFVPQEAPKTVAITVNVIASAFVNKEQIQARGEAVYAAVVALRSSGYLVNLSWMTTTNAKENGKAWVVHHVPLSTSDRPMDEDKLAFWLQHPSALRRIQFAIGSAGDDEYQNAVTQLQGYPAWLGGHSSHDLRAPKAMLKAVAEIADVTVESLPEEHSEEEVEKLATKIVGAVKEKADGLTII